jgi:hypothetical protein
MHPTSVSKATPRLMRYYFDFRVGGELAIDDEGLEFSTVEAVHEDAARSLVDMARDAIRTNPFDSAGHRLAIEVRDESGPLLVVKFTFDIDKTR